MSLSQISLGPIITGTKNQGSLAITSKLIYKTRVNVNCGVLWELCLRVAVSNTVNNDATTHQYKSRGQMHTHLFGEYNDIGLPRKLSHVSVARRTNFPRSYIAAAISQGAAAWF